MVRMISIFLIVLLVPMVLSFTVQKENKLQAKFIIEVNLGMKRMLNIIYVVFIPLGLLAALTCTLFLADKEADVVNTVSSGMTFVVVVGFYFMRATIVKKKIFVEDQKLKVKSAWRKPRNINIGDIGYAKIIQRTVKIYDIYDKKIVAITALYNNYNVLIKWLEQNEVRIINQKEVSAIV